MFSKRSFYPPNLDVKKVQLFFSKVLFTREDISLCMVEEINIDISLSTFVSKNVFHAYLICRLPRTDFRTSAPRGNFSKMQLYHQSPMLLAILLQHGRRSCLPVIVSLSSALGLMTRLSLAKWETGCHLNVELSSYSALSQLTLCTNGATVKMDKQDGFCLNQANVRDRRDNFIL